MKNGTPAHRQLSMSSRNAAYVSVVEPSGAPVDVEVAVVLAAHVVGRVGSAMARHSATCWFLIVVGIVAGRRFHRGRGEHLHEVVDDHVAQRADRVVEVSAVLDAEVSPPS